MGRSGPPGAAGLAAAKKIVQATMKHKAAKLLFNEPVDPEALQLPDYHDVVQRPIDLGLIFKRLTQGQDSDWKNSHYQSAGQVFRDVELVWENCLAYNNRPEDAPTHEVCMEVRVLFESKWRQAQLEEEAAVPPREQWLSEADVPERFSVQQGSLQAPLRFVDDFDIRAAAEPSRGVSLEDVPATAANIRGRLVPSAGSQDQGLSYIETGELLDWSFEFGKLPCIWAVTDQAWYQLLRPAAAYQALAAPQQQLLDVCAAAFDIRQEGYDISQCAREAVELNAEDAEPAAASRLAARAEAQLTAIEQEAARKAGKGKKRKSAAGPLAGKQKKRAKEDPDASASAQKGAAAAAREASERPDATPARESREPSAQVDAGEAAGSLGARRRRPSSRWLDEGGDDDRKLPGKGGRPSQGLEEDDSGDEVMPRKLGRREADLQARRRKYAAAKAAEAQAREEAAREKAVQLKAKAKREKEAVALRGEPPPPNRAFRLPMRLVPDLVMVWQLLQVLAPVAQIPLLPLWRLEAALSPGPHIPPPAPREPTPEPTTEEAASQQIESIVRSRAQKHSQNERSGMKVRIRLDGTLVSDENPPSSDLSPSGRKLPPVVPPNDLPGAASAVVLRDAHCAFLRSYEAKGLAFDKAAPISAQLYHADSQTPLLWTERAAAAILGAPDGWLEDEARAAALKLSYSEYGDLSVEERVLVLSAMSHLALSSEAVRDHFAAAVEPAVAVAPRPSAKKQRGAAEAGLEAAEGAPAAKPEPPIAAGSPGEWARWVEGVRGSMCRPLGQDLERRRYWVLGEAAAAWRVYVEEQNGTLWGWYDGSEITALLAWLKKGSVEKEAGLVKSLSSLPLPIRPTLPTAPGTPYSAQSSAPAGEAAAEGFNRATVIKSEDLEARRSDGYRTLTNPQLRGEGNWPKVTLYALMEARIFFSTDAMLTNIPFWFKGQDWLARHLRLSDTLAMAKGPMDAGRALLEVESALEAAGCLRPEWKLHWQPQWRARLSHCYDMRDALLCCAALEEYAVWEASTMPRQAFTRVAKDVGCQLYFPYPGDQVVVLRTGMLMHLKAYMQALGLTEADSPGMPAKPEAHLPALEAANNASPTKPSATQKEPTADPPPTINSTSISPPASRSSPAEAYRSSPTEAVPPPEVSPRPSGELNSTPEPHGKEPSEPTRSEAATPKRPVVDYFEGSRLLAAAREEVRSHWEALLAAVEAMHPVQRYKIASISYRRSLRDAAGGSRGERGEEEYSPVGQWPTAWLLLRPSRVGPRQQLAADTICLPLRIDGALPDFLVPIDTFDKGMQRLWHAGDRFRMFFAARSSSRAGGTFYKGTVTNVRQQQPSAIDPLELREAYDPWEALEVEWDIGGGHGGNDCEKVSPWELESDPDEDLRREEERKKEQEASSRAARAARGARRAGEELPEQPELLPAASQQLPTASQQPHPAPAPLPLPFLPRIQHAPSRAASPAAERARSMTPAADDSRESSMADAGAMPHPLAHDREYMPGSNAVVKPVPKEVLGMLEGLSKDRFATLLNNWHRARSGRFKVPIFAHQELDLHRVFWEVMRRGGFPVVTEAKQWKEVCRSLEVDLTGQTSASYNMRLNYEKCLLEFEMYLAAGCYAADLAAGTAPSPDSVTTQPPRISLPPGMRMGLPAAEVDIPAAVLPMTMTTRHASRSISTPASAAPAAGTGGPLPGGMTFTQLLRGDGDDVAAVQRTIPPVPVQYSLPQAPRPQYTIPLPSHPALRPVSHPQETRKRSWRRMIAPADVSDPAPDLNGDAHVPPTHQAPPAPIGKPPGPPIGSLMQSLGHQLVGKLVMRFWPDDGDHWWAAHVEDWTAGKGHKLVYEKGTEDESYEWAKLGEFGPDELQPHGSHPLPPLLPVGAHRGPPAPALPLVLPPAVAAMLANNPMLAINALLSNGRSASELHRLVDQAVAVQPRQLPGSRVPSGLPSSFPQPRIAMQPLSAPLISPTPFLPSRPPMQQLTPQLPSVPQQQQQQQQAATSSMTMTTRRSGAAAVNSADGKLQRGSEAQPSNMRVKIKFRSSQDQPAHSLQDGQHSQAEAHDHDIDQQQDESAAELLPVDDYESTPDREPTRASPEPRQLGEAPQEAEQAQLEEPPLQHQGSFTAMLESDFEANSSPEIDEEHLEIPPEDIAFLPEPDAPADAQPSVPAAAADPHVQASTPASPQQTASMSADRGMQQLQPASPVAIADTEHVPSSPAQQQQQRQPDWYSFADDAHIEPQHKAQPHANGNSIPEPPTKLPKLKLNLRPSSADSQGAQPASQEAALQLPTSAPAEASTAATQQSNGHVKVNLHFGSRRSQSVVAPELHAAMPQPDSDPE